MVWNKRVGVRLIPCRGSGHHRQSGELDRPKPVGCGITEQGHLQPGSTGVFWVLIWAHPACY